MKKIIFILVFFTLVAAKSSMAQVTLNFESGNIGVEQGNCWVFGAVKYSNLEFRISDFWSGRTNQLTNPATDACWIKTPWIMPGSGNITMKTRLENASGTTRGVVFSYISYDPASATATKEGTTTAFYTYTFPAPLDIWVKDLSVPLPAAIANSSSSYKILVSFIGTGGSSRAFVDDISIPGTYNSNIANNCLPLVVIQDVDNDGVADADDAYPSDINRAYNSYFPSNTGSGTLAFEDLWPAQGDYDFNDVVVDYRIQTVTNAANNVVEVFGRFALRASGGCFNDGFGFQLDGISPNKITSVSGNSITSSSIYNLASNGLESGQTYATCIVFDDSHMIDGNYLDYNTIPGTLPKEPKILNVHLTFINNGIPAPGGTVANTALTPEVFNFFIVGETLTGEIIGDVQPTYQDRGKEIHLADRVPTSLANTSLFKSFDDDSGAEKYYKTANNLPWGINILQGFDYPIEKTPINEAYLHFIEWAGSAGVLYPNWFTNTQGYRVPVKIY